ncbi:MAG: hypothetical protein KDK39_12945 [Leptospiraceae bacterium]|nr:hypothetical protein [Leptospiraceae bacterium]
MNTESGKSTVTLFLEANLSANARAAIYSLPLLITWLPGILFEAETAARNYARVAFTMTLAFLAANLLIYFMQGLLAYQGPTATLIAAWLAFGTNALAALAYVGGSFFLAWQAWQKPDAAPPALLFNASLKLENWLKL